MERNRNFPMKGIFGFFVELRSENFQSAVQVGHLSLSSGQFYISRKHFRKAFDEDRFVGVRGRLCREHSLVIILCDRLF